MNLYDIAIARKLSGGGGGGGSSDFSIAKVTITIAKSKANLSLPLIVGDSTVGTLMIASVDEVPTQTVNMPLYKGSLTIMPISVTGTVSTSGDCAYNYGQFNITGDCTITIS